MYAIHRNLLLHSRERSLNDNEVQNIEKSLQRAKTQSSISSRTPSKSIEFFSLNKKQQFITKTKENQVQSKLKRMHSSIDSYSQIQKQYNTSPPIGLKRPVTSLNDKINQPVIRDKLSKDVYYEAIMEDLNAGQVFMKYLKFARKIVNYKTSI